MPQVGWLERAPLAIKTAGTLRSSRVSRRTEAQRTVFGDLEDFNQENRERMGFEALKRFEIG